MWEITDKEARFSNVCRFLGGDNYYYLGMCPSGCMLGNIQGLFAFQMKTITSKYYIIGKKVSCFPPFCE